MDGNRSYSIKLIYDRERHEKFAVVCLGLDEYFFLAVLRTFFEALEEF